MCVTFPTLHYLLQKNAYTANFLCQIHFLRNVIAARIFFMQFLNPGVVTSLHLRLHTKILLLLPITNIKKHSLASRCLIDRFKVDIYNRFNHPQFSDLHMVIYYVLKKK